MKIYTRTGDAGQTSLVGGIRVPKTHPRLEAYGTLDELNSHVGLLISHVDDSDQRELLHAIQEDLFVVSSNLATDTTQKALAPSGVVGEERVRALERAIDQLTEMLPPQRTFVLPRGCTAAAEAHVCRTVCRRAERRILALAESGVQVDEQVLCYVNRLSDYFFMLARALNTARGQVEACWNPQR